MENKGITSQNEQTTEKINWKQKLSSRKFWAAIVGFITPLLIVFNVNSLNIEQIVGIITAGGALVAYILSEGYVDGKREDKARKNDDGSKFE